MLEKSRGNGNLKLHLWELNSKDVMLTIVLGL